MNTILEIKNLYKNYQTIEKEIIVLHNINIKVNDGDFIAIVGPSGAGKSTLLSIIAGLEDYEKGNIIKDNIKIGYMLQKDYLMPYLTILDNCLLGLKINKKCTKDNIKRVKNLLTKYGLEDYIYSYPDDLSGGQRQRAALIRTLALNPDILLLDEPFSALDYQTRLNISKDIKNIIKNENKTLIIVTHDISEAINMCNKIIVLSKTPSSIKSIYKIDYEFNDDIISNRTSEEFMYYYKKIWRDLND
ncbi:MAG: ABC transporter ATP-binding protein [Bacilli bacterium]|nr:ABC transporter ATP-binding protein [Bacilli bacterium]